MEIKYHARNYHVSEKLSGVIERKLEKIEKYFDNANAIVVCTKVGNNEKMEITIMASGHAFRAQEDGRDMFKNIDLALSKIERQIVKNRDKLRTVLRKEATERKNAGKEEFIYVKSKEVEEIVAPVEIAKNKSFPIVSLTDFEAEIALSTIDYDFFIYADSETGQVKVMYSREDKKVGVIEITNAKIQEPVTHQEELAKEKAEEKAEKAAAKKVPARTKEAAVPAKAPKAVKTAAAKTTTKKTDTATKKPSAAKK